MTERLPQRVSVLVVGAGPTGLTTAALLRDLGLDTLLIDGADGPSEHSKALAVQARTLEQFERLGIADEAARLGRPFAGLRIVRDGRQVAAVPLALAGRGLTRYPYVLSLEQSRTEALLSGALHARGGAIRWRHELSGLAPEAGGVTARIGDGRREHVVRADWVVGADGAGSFVRNASGEAFSGGTYEQTFLLADLRLGATPADGVLLDVLTDGVLALFPLPGDRWYRAITTVPPDVDPDTLDAAAIARLIARLSSRRVDPELPRWNSTYRLHHRRAEHFRRGRLLMAGDAAHVHSPVGGQGMNTGIGDAYNLAWKLARVVRGDARERLLDTYASEREPFAEALLSSTDQAFEVMTSAGLVRRIVRRRVLPPLVNVVGRWPAARRAAFRLISQLAIDYRGSALAVGQTRGLRVAPGDRAPDVTLPDGSRLFSRLNQVRHDLLVVPGSATPGRDDLAAALGSLADEVGWITPVVRRTSGRPARGGVWLIRPDGYLGVVAPGRSAVTALARYARVVSGET